MSKQDKKYDVMSYHIMYYMNDPGFIKGFKNAYRKAYNAVLEEMKKDKPEKCIMCAAFYWDAKKQGPGCSIGGEITVFDTAEKCPLDK